MRNFHITAGSESDVFELMNEKQGKPTTNVLGTRQFGNALLSLIFSPKKSANVNLCVVILKHLPIGEVRGSKTRTLCTVRNLQNLSLPTFREGTQSQCSSADVSRL